MTVTPSPHAQSSSTFIRSTLNAVPASNALLKKSKLPLALLLEPYPSVNVSKSVILTRSFSNLKHLSIKRKMYLWFLILLLLGVLGANLISIPLYDSVKVLLNGNAICVDWIMMVRMRSMRSTMQPEANIHV